MGYHPRIEAADLANLTTSKCRNDELWFVNNKPLTDACLGYLAKYVDKYEVTPYAFSIEGNHIHFVGEFPKMNRSNFMRDLNSCIARAVPRYVPEYSGGGLFKRRYSNEFLPGSDDIKEYFFYTVLQPVNDGLVEDIRDYPEYNCFWDAIYELKKEFEVINWAQYNSDKRFKEVKLKDYIYRVELKYQRLPGYEDLSPEEYWKMMIKELDERQARIKQERLENGKKAVAGVEYLRSVKPGSKPVNPKTSTINTPRPRILSICKERWEKRIEWYFEVYFEYKSASVRYRAGDKTVEFPVGTYPPPLHCVM